MIKKFTNSLLVLLLAILVIAFSCKKDENTAAKSSKTIEGEVLDETNNPLADVYVSAYGKTTQTNSNGKFSIPDVSGLPDRIVVSFQKDGYYDVSNGTLKNGDDYAYFKTVLTKKVLLGSINIADGGTISNDEVSVTVEPNSFTAADGSALDEPVQFYANYINPDDNDFSSRMPGGDFSGQNSSNEEGVLESFGVVQMSAETPSKKNVKLSKAMSVKMKIPTSKVASAPATMSVWTLNGQAKWIEVGSATKQGSEYTFFSSQIAATNCDRWSRNGIVQGSVCHDGKPAANAEVKINQLVTLTNKEGNYKLMVPSGSYFIVETPWASSGNQMVNANQTITVDVGCTDDPGGNTYNYKVDIMLHQTRINCPVYTIYSAKNGTNSRIPRDNNPVCWILCTDNTELNGSKYDWNIVYYPNGLLNSEKTIFFYFWNWSGNSPYDFAKDFSIFPSGDLLADFEIITDGASFNEYFPSSASDESGMYSANGISGKISNKNGILTLDMNCGYDDYTFKVTGTVQIPDDIDKAK
jgi:hypothetical protein